MPFDPELEEALCGTSELMSANCERLEKAVTLAVSRCLGDRTACRFVKEVNPLNRFSFTGQGCPRTGVFLIV